MKRFVLVIAILFSIQTFVFSQISLTSGSPSYTENFDGMGALLTLPTNWRMAASTASPTWAAASTTVTQQASTGSPVTGGTYNWGSIASERAIGAMTSGGFGSPNSPLCFFTNGGTSNITDLAISYDAEKYRTNMAAASIEFYYSLNGSTWISVASGDIAAGSFGTGASAYQFSPPITTINVTGINITALNIAPASNFYLRWNINTTGVNSQGIGIDNVSLTATFAPPNTVTTGAITATPFILADCLSPGAGRVDFTSTDIFPAGNVFTAQLSDDIGSFTTPVFLGSIPLSGTDPSGVIPIVIPAGTVSGTGYKIRVIGSNPAVTGSSSDAFQIIQLGACASSHTDSYRSFKTGDWSTLTTWESQSPDNPTWIAATMTPTNLANNIFIRNTHTVTVTSSVTVDQVEIQSGGILENNMPALNMLTVANGTGDDIDIKSGGVYLVSSGQSFTNNFAINGGAVMNVEGGGTIQIGTGGTVGGGNNAYGITPTSFVWDDASIFRWNSVTTPGIQTTFFPDAISVIPVLQFTATTTFSMGGGSPTIVNGRLENTSPIAFTGASTKTFRNGIVSSADLDGVIGTSQKFIINGATAQLGGAGNLITPAGGLEIGTSSVVTMTSNKTITGDINLLFDTYVDLDTYNLTVSGTVAGGTTNYIRTASTGALILKTVNAAGKQFPVGHTKYNPITIQKGNNYDWTVNVNDGVTADIPRTTDGAVWLTWGITPSVNPPISGADIIFQFDSTLAGGQIGAEFNTPPNNTPNNVQVWHRKQGYWLASGTTVPVDPGPAGYVTAKALNALNFSPYGISRISLPLPIKLVNFSSIKISAGLAIINWELAACCSKDALFELEKSTDSRNFTLATTINGSETNKFYFYNDSRLGKGISYYRLKMTDTDGSVKYSKVIAIVNEEKGFVITSIAPNPVQHTASLTISAAKQSSVDFKVYDVAGNLVKQWQSTIAAGNNVLNMDVAALTNGTYHVLASSAGTRTVFRFIKQ